MCLQGNIAHVGETHTVNAKGDCAAQVVERKREEQSTSAKDVNTPAGEGYTSLFRPTDVKESALDSPDTLLPTLDLTDGHVMKSSKGGVAVSGGEENTVRARRKMSFLKWFCLCA